MSELGYRNFKSGYHTIILKAAVRGEVRASSPGEKGCVRTRELRKNRARVSCQRMEYQSVCSNKENLRGRGELLEEELLLYNVGTHQRKGASYSHDSSIACTGNGAHVDSLFIWIAMKSMINTQSSK